MYQFNDRGNQDVNEINVLELYNTTAWGNKVINQSINRLYDEIHVLELYNTTARGYKVINQSINRLSGSWTRSPVSMEVFKNYSNLLCYSY